MIKRAGAVLLAVVSFCGILVGAFWLWDYRGEQQKELGSFQELSALLAPVPDAGTGTKSLEELQKLNPDCVGWVRIKGTDIDFPVVQTVEDPEYYLHRNFQKEDSSFGVPFLDARCSANSANQIVYGHTLADGTMFTGLHKYEQEEYLALHPTISFLTEKGMGHYTIFAVMRISKTIGEAEANIFNFLGDPQPEEFRETMEFIRSHTLYETEIVPQLGKQFLTLTTCNTPDDDGLRLVIVALKEK